MLKLLYPRSEWKQTKRKRTWRKSRLQRFTFLFYGQVQFELQVSTWGTGVGIKENICFQYVRIQFNLLMRKSVGDNYFLFWQSVTSAAS